MSYRVVTALVVAHTRQGDVYTYHGGIVPDSVPDAEVRRLLAEGFLEEVVEPAAVDNDNGTDADTGSATNDDNGTDLGSMNLDELRKFADEHSVDLAGATRKTDIIAAIQAAKS